MMNVLDIYSGGGGGILGGELLGWKTVCAIERDEYCQNLLIQRQKEGSLSPFPIYSDADTFQGEPWRWVDCVVAGVPCQPFSVAGAGKAELDERDQWKNLLRILREMEPEHIFLENVPGFLRFSLYFGWLLGQLAESGYCVRYKIRSARSIGANHLRKRLWIYGWRG